VFLTPAAVTLANVPNPTLIFVEYDPEPTTHELNVASNIDEIALLIVVVPVAAPILKVVAALAKFTVVAVVLIKSKDVDGVVNDVVTAGLVAGK
jgi:hypothetical protein